MAVGFDLTSMLSFLHLKPLSAIQMSARCDVLDVLERRYMYDIALHFPQAHQAATLSSRGFASLSGNVPVWANFPWSSP